MIKKMNSINETARLCRENNIGISRKLIISLAHEGVIPCVKVGRSILINWNGLMNYLDTCKLSSSSNISSTGIRKISS